METPMPDRIEIPLETAPEYRRFRATMFWGGVSHDELEFSLIEDSVWPPENFMLDKVGDGLYRDDPAVRGTPKRILHATVVMPVSALPSIIEWLKQKYGEAMDMRKRSEGGKERMACAERRTEG